MPDVRRNRIRAFWKRLCWRVKGRKGGPPCPFCGYEASDFFDAMFHITKHWEPSIQTEAGRGVNQPQPDRAARGGSEIVSSLDLDKLTPKTREIISKMIKKFCRWQYHPMAQCNQPDRNDGVFRAAEWLAPKLMKMEQPTSPAPTRTGERRGDETPWDRQS